VRAAILTTLVLVLAACGRDETVRMTEGTPSQSSTASSAPQDRPPQPTALNPVVPVEKHEPSSRPSTALPTQEVHLIEYAIHMPATMNAGKVAFNVENGGKEDHAFEIEGNGIEEKTQILKRGDTEDLEIELRPGTYTVYCPVKDHAKRGMKTTITVK
jgi:hypothetical protein